MAAQDRTYDRSMRETGDRVAVGLASVAGFLAIEPFVRACLWWRFSETALPGALHADALWLGALLAALTGTALVSDMRRFLGEHRTLVGLGCIWAVAAVVSSSLAVEGEPWISNRWAIHVAFGLSLLLALRRQPDRADRLLVACAAGCLGYVLVLVAFVMVGERPHSYDWVTGVPGAFNIRHVGFEAMAAALGASLYRPAATRSAVTWLLRAAAVAGWAVLFWSGGRGSFMAAVLALGALVWLTTRERRTERLIETGCLAAIGFGLATLHVPPGGSFGAWRTLGFTTMAGGSSGAEVSSGRFAIWIESIQAIAANPWFGIGEGQMKYRLASAMGLYPQPHNLLLQGPLAWGLPGGVAFLAAIGTALLRAAARLKDRAAIGSPAAAGFAVALALVANAMLDGTLFHMRPVTLFLIGICVALTAATDGARPTRK